MSDSSNSYTHAAHAKASHCACKILALGTLGALAALPACTILAYRHYVHHRCAPFLKSAEVAFEAPGQSDGFVLQDLDFAPEMDAFIVSGYASDAGPSPIYVCPTDGEPYPVFVEMPDGSLYRGHGAAVAVDGSRVLLTTATGFMALDASDLKAAKPNDKLCPIDHRFVDLTPAFMGIYDDVLYLGAYYYPVIFATPGRMHFETPGGQRNDAVMYAFAREEGAPLGFAADPFAVYTLPEETQGMAALPDGRFVLSCSFGFANSHLRVFDPQGHDADGSYLAQWKVAPRYDLDNRYLCGSLTVPPMSEGITIHDGCLYLPFEAASKRYRIGALTGGKHVYRLPLSALDNVAQSVEAQPKR